jgi:SSS family solute:Na+ symporter
MEEVAQAFGWLDWLVVGGYLLLTTWVGHRLRGQQATIRDFFLGGRKLPWPAVSGSIIATEISALTFIGVPGMVYAVGGDFTYLQWALGSVLARVLVGLFLVKRYYEEEIFSPYDYMSNRLGGNVRTLTTVLFSIGAILGQSVRVLVTATILSSVTVLPFTWCIVIIGIFAMIWTLMGGMTTVIWTDVMQFGLFVFGGALALGWMLVTFDGGAGHLLEVAGGAEKLRLFDLTSPFDEPGLGFTLWVAILAMPFQNLAAFGTDQLNAQRMFCCADARGARRAIIWSSVSQVVAVLMMFVGAGLFVYYLDHPPGAELKAIFSEDADRVFPVWIVTVLPVGLSGLVLAGAFAAAISSLDSILAALSQTTLSLIRGGNYEAEEGKGGQTPRQMIRLSRLLVILWGILLTAFAIFMQAVRDDTNLINLAFGMTAYTYGPMLGILFLALVGRRISRPGLIVGLLLSLAVTLYVRPDLAQTLELIGWISPETAEQWESGISYAWLYPVTCLMTFFSAWLPVVLRSKANQGSPHDSRT